MSEIIWRTERRNIEDLIPAEYNPRKANEKEYDNLKISIERFNLADPVIINQNNTVIGGHFRLKILKDQGYKEIDVRVPDRLLNDQEERELNLRLNKNLGLWDYDLLADMDEDLLRDVGFEDWEIGQYLKDFQNDDIDPIEDPSETSNFTIKCKDLSELAQLQSFLGLAGEKTTFDKFMEIMNAKSNN